MGKPVGHVRGGYPVMHRCCLVAQLLYISWYGHCGARPDEDEYLILAQSPVAGSKVKTGRAVYVTVNSSSSPTIALPDVVDNCSEREAEARLSAMGFQLTEPQRIHGEKEWVYGIISRGRHVATGDRVSTDYPLTLVVGDGMYDVGDNREVLRLACLCRVQGQEAKKYQYE